MLQCVMSIIEKAKRAVSVLQERCIRDREEMATWARRMAEEAEAEVKRRAGILVCYTNTLVVCVLCASYIKTE